MFFFFSQVKEQNQNSATQSRSSSPFSSNRCMIGTHRQNLDANNPNQRTFTATIPQDYFDGVRSSNLTKVQLDHIEKNLLNQLNDLQSSIQHLNNNSENSTNLFQNESSSSVSNFNTKNPLFTNNSNQYTSLSGNLASFPNLESASLSRFTHDKKIDRSNNNSELDSLGERISNGTSDESTNIEIIERPMTSMTSRKNVSFNNDIDVRIFPKNSKNPKIIESYLLPLTQPKQLSYSQSHQQPVDTAFNDENEPNNTYTSNIKNSSGKNLLNLIFFIRLF